MNLTTTTRSAYLPEISEEEKFYNADVYDARGINTSDNAYPKGQYIYYNWLNERISSCHYTEPFSLQRYGFAFYRPFPNNNEPPNEWDRKNYIEFTSAMSLSDYRAIKSLYMAFYLMKDDTDKPKASFVLGFDKPNLQSIKDHGSLTPQDNEFNGEIKHYKYHPYDISPDLRHPNSSLGFLIPLKAYLPGKVLELGGHCRMNQDSVLFTRLSCSVSSDRLNKILYDHIKGETNGSVRIEMYANLPIESSGLLQNILEKPMGDESIEKHWFDFSGNNVLSSQTYFKDANGALQVDPRYATFVKDASQSKQHTYSLLFANSINRPMPYMGRVVRKNADLKSNIDKYGHPILHQRNWFGGSFMPPVSRVRLCFFRPDPSAVKNADFYRAPGFDANEDTDLDPAFYTASKYAFLYNLWVTHSPKGVFLRDKFEGNDLKITADKMFSDLPEVEVDKAIDLVDATLPKDAVATRVRPIESRCVDIYLYSYVLDPSVPAPSIILNIPFKTEEGSFVGRNFYEIQLPSTLLRNCQYTYYVKPYSLGSTSWKSPVKLDIPLLVKPWAEGKGKDVKIH